MENKFEEYINDCLETIDGYPYSAVSQAFQTLSLQNRVLVLANTPEYIYPKLVSLLPLEELVNLINEVNQQQLHFKQEQVMGVFSQLQSLLEGQDTIADQLRKGQILSGLFNAVKDSEKQKTLLEVLEVINADAAEAIRQSVVDERTLLACDDRSIQRLIREIDNRSLVTFLKRADEKLKEKFISNMSKRLAEMFIEDLEFIGKVSDKDYEREAERIAMIYRRLIEAGEIIAPA